MLYMLRLPTGTVAEIAAQKPTPDSILLQFCDLCAVKHAVLYKIAFCLYSPSGSSSLQLHVLTRSLTLKLSPFFLGVRNPNHWTPQV